MEHVCVVGHVTRDRIRVAGRPRRDTPGGTALYAAIAYAKLGAHVDVVTKLRAADAPELLVKLREAGATVRWSASPATTVFENVYESDAQDERVQRVRELAPPLAAADLGDAAPDWFHVGPLTRDDVPVSLLRAMRERGARVALDVQGMLRQIDADRVRLVDWSDKAAGLACVDVVKADGREARLLTGEGDPAAAALALARLGPSEAIVTLGSRGSVVVSGDRIHRVPAISPRVVADATGCGDTYLAAYVLFRARGEPPHDAARLAAAAAALKLEHLGALRAGESEVRARAA